MGALAVPAAGTTALASPSMNENEGGSAYPPNPDAKSGSCLIAGFHALSCTSPSYYNPYRGVNKNTLSVDMVRLSLTFKGDRGEWLSRKGAQQMRTSAKQLENGRSSGRPESRSKGVDR